jgi:hypothetical protein
MTTTAGNAHKIKTGMILLLVLTRPKTNDNAYHLFPNHSYLQRVWTLRLLRGDYR